MLSTLFAAALSLTSAPVEAVPAMDAKTMSTQEVGAKRGKVRVNHERVGAKRGKVRVNHERVGAKRGKVRI